MPQKLVFTDFLKRPSVDLSFPLVETRTSVVL